MKQGNMIFNRGWGLDRLSEKTSEGKDRHFRIIYLHLYYILWKFLYLCDTWISVRFYPYRAQEGDSEKEVELPVFDFSIVVVTLEVWWLLTLGAWAWATLLVVSCFDSHDISSTIQDWLAVSPTAHHRCGQIGTRPVVWTVLHYRVSPFFKFL
jgi:hypothetical protein